MIGLAVSLNNIFLTLLFIFVYLPLVLLFWLMVGTIISFFIGPLGYVVAAFLAFYYWQNGD